MHAHRYETTELQARIQSGVVSQEHAPVVLYHSVDKLDNPHELMPAWGERGSGGMVEDLGLLPRVPSERIDRPVEARQEVVLQAEGGPEIRHGDLRPFLAAGRPLRQRQGLGPVEGDVVEGVVVALRTQNPIEVSTDAPEDMFGVGVGGEGLLNSGGDDCVSVA